MKRISLVATAALAIGLAACGSKTGTTNTTTTTTTTDTEITNVPAGEGLDNAINAEAGEEVGSAQDFANKAAASDAFEVASAKLAAAQASAAKVKSFAAQMIKAHEESTAKLKKIAAGLSTAITPDATLSAEQQSTLDDLKSKTGADFDKAYADAAVEAHEDALDALKDYADAGDVPQFKSFAANMVPTVTAHLNMAKGLK